MSCVCLMWEYETPRREIEYELARIIMDGLNDFKRTYIFSPSKIEINPEVRKLAFKNKRDLDGVVFEEDRTVPTNQVRYCFDESMHELADKRRKERNEKIRKEQPTLAAILNPAQSNTSE